MYSEADVVVIPSLFESVSLPAWEAMLRGKPLLVADTSILREQIGDGALYFDPNNVQAIASQINILIQDQEVRAQLKAAAKQRVALFNWDYAASQLKQIFIQVKNGKT